MTGMGDIDKGKYLIKSADYDRFLDLLHNYIFEQNYAVNLIEQHNNEGGPILIDLDFRYEGGGRLVRKFTETHIRSFVLAYAKILCKFFAIEKFAKPLRFVVQIKPVPEVDTKKGVHKDGIHINCPDITLSPEIQYGLRGELIQQKIIETIFGETDIMNSATNVFDRLPIYKNGWFFHGCSKPGKPSYENRFIFRVESTGADSVRLVNEDIGQYTDREYMSLLSIRKNHSETDYVELRTENETEWKKLVEIWSQADPKQAPAVNTETIQLGVNNGEQSFSVRAAYTADDIKLAFRLARECLNPELRAGTYHKWVHLALCLRNICDNKEAFDTWIHISRKVPGYEHTSDDEFGAKWSSLRASQAEIEKQVKMGTLYHWVKQDNFAKYEEIRDEDNVDYAYNNNSGTHVEIANLIVRLYRHEYCCAPNVKSYDWFHYEGHYWKAIQQPMDLRGAISTRIRQIYVKADRMISDNELLPNISEEMKKSLMEKKKRIMKVKQSLENSGFKDSVMKELTEKFYKEDFKDKLNLKVSLLGVGNGVLDLHVVDPDTKKVYVEFRDGRPDDNISLQMGKNKGFPAINYVPYDSSNPHNKEIIEFFRKLFPNDELREYFLTLLSACLFGRNKEQRFYVLQGEGSNGKSALMRLIEMVFGEYQCSTQATLVTRKQDSSGAAAPQLVKLKNMRFVSLQEPEEGEKINASLMKQLSGEDMISARGLYQDLVTFAVTARIFLCCNRLPPVNTVDNGAWRRLRVIKFESEFRDADAFKNEAHIKEMAKQNIFPKESSIETSPDHGFPAWREAFLSMLVWYYKEKYLPTDCELKEPNSVNSESKDYKASNNSFASFMTDRLIKEIGCETETKEIRKDYKIWLSDNPERRSITPEDVRKELIANYGKPITRKGKEMFQGVRIAGLLEDVSGNYVEPQVEAAEAAEAAEEEKIETIVTEQESLTIIEPAEAKKAGKPKKK